MKNKIIIALFSIGLTLVSISCVAQEVNEPLESVEAKPVAVIEEESKDIAEEKASLEREAQLKSQAAEVAKDELAILKQEAEGGSSEAKEKFKLLEDQARALEKEALILADKAKLAEKKLLFYTTLKEGKIASEGVLSKLARLGIIFGIGILLFLLLKFVINRVNYFISRTQKDAIYETDTVQRVRTLSQLISWVGLIAIGCTVTYMALESFGFNVAPLLAGAGILGLSFGFGGQYLIRDIITGVFILMEGQYHINDVVKIGELSGLVESVNLRVTKLRDLEGRAIYIPNGEIKSVINYTKEWSRALLTIGVAYKENVDKVMEVIKEIGKELREDKYYGRFILADLEMLGVDDFGSSEVTIKFFVKTIPIKQWSVGREFRRRIKNKFDELGIEIPFPHQTIYWGSGEDNKAFNKFFEKKK